MKKRSMSMVRAGAEDIRNMRVRGATRLALYASEVLVKAMEVEAEDAKRETLEEFSIILLKSRPTAISLSNALRYMIEMAGDFRGHILIRKLKEAHESLKAYVILAQKRIEEMGMEVFECKMKLSLLTHCNSQTAIGVIRRGWEEGYVKRVFSLEARPRYQGRITVRQLSSYGIETIMIVDSACNYYMGEVDRVIVGADTVFPNGDLVNKIGTSQVALAAMEHNVPLYSAASILKMAPDGFSKEKLIIEMRPVEEIAPPEEYPGVKILNPAFDLTPSRHVTGYITEWGVLKPAEVSKYTFSVEKVLRLIEESE